MQPPPPPPPPAPTNHDRLRAQGVMVEPDAVLLGMPIVSLAGGSVIRVGSKCILCSDPAMTALGVNHPVILRTLRSGARLEIGADTGISGGVICAAVGVRIGSSCLIGANV